MNDQISLEGPIEFVNGKMMIRIPLEYGGNQLKEYAKGIGLIDDEYLTIEIKPWLAEQLKVAVGSLVLVDNLNGKLTITRSEKNDQNLKIKEVIIEGKNIRCLADFYNEIQLKLTKNLDYEIGKNLDAFRDTLRGGFGVHEYGEKLKIILNDSDICKKNLGWDETIRYLKAKLDYCHPSNKIDVQNDLLESEKHQGETIFEIIVGIFRDSKNIEFQMNQ